MRLKALAEINTMHSFAPLCNFAKRFARFCKIQQTSPDLAAALSAAAGFQLMESIENVEMMKDVVTCHRFVSAGPETLPRRPPHRGYAAKQKHIEEIM